MSKSLKNVVNPDDVIRDYGADSLRLYEMFMGPLQAVKPWNTKGVDGVYRFLKRVNKMVTEQPIVDRALTKAEAKTLNATVKKVDEDLAAMSFNTAISAMMVFVNAFAGEGRTCRARRRRSSSSASRRSRRTSARSCGRRSATRRRSPTSRSRRSIRRPSWRTRSKSPCRCSASCAGA